MSLWRWEMCTLRYGAHVAPASLNTEVGLAGDEAIHALWRLKVTPQLLLALLWIAVAALVMLACHRLTPFATRSTIALVGGLLVFTRWCWC